MARGIWSGAISFGLLNIPVSVMTAEEDERLSFHMIDKKNIVKGYEYKRDQYVLLN